jgi:hypothetical protein
VSIHRPIIAPLYPPIFGPRAGGLPWDRSIGGGAPAVALPVFPTLSTERARWLASDVTLGGADVASFTDLTGTGNLLDAVGAGNRPLYVATGFNGGAQPYAEFDGALEYLRVAAFSWGGVVKPFTIWMVVQTVAPTAGDCLFQSGPTVPYSLVSAAGVPDQCTAGGGIFSAATSSLNTPRLFVFSNDGTQRVYINSAQEDSDVNASAAPADGGVLSIAAGIAAAATCPMRFAGGGVMRAAITAPELAALYTYASAWWGV